MLQLFKNIGLSKIAVFLVLFAILAVGIFLGAREILAGGTTLAPGHGAQIDAHGICREVVNQHASLSIWVPWLTSAEWNSSILHRPTHVAMAECPPPCVPSCPPGTCHFQSDGCGGTIWCGDICPTPPPGAGCFLSGTRVLMADGSYKAIQEIKPGDIVLSYNPRSSTVALEKVKELRVYKENPGGYFLWNGTLKITGNHPVWVPANHAWQRAETLKVGDQVLGPASKPITLTSIEWVAGYFTVYNLKLAGPNNTFFTEGVLVHNMVLK